MGYVGFDSIDLAGKMTHEICKQIINITMKDKIGNQHTVITPDELFGKCTSTDTGLSICAPTWSITLCSIYFNCLISSIQDKIENNDFSICLLNCQDTKTLKLGALCLVRADTASEYKLLVDEEDLLHRMLPHQAGTRGSVFLNECDQEAETLILKEPISQQPPLQGQVLFQLFDREHDF